MSIRMRQRIVDLLNMLLPLSTGAFNRGARRLSAQIEPLKKQNVELGQQFGDAATSLRQDIEELKREYIVLGRAYREQLAELSEQNSSLNVQIDELMHHMRDIEACIRGLLQKESVISERLSESLRDLKGLSASTHRCASEVLWAEVYNNTVSDSDWLHNNDFSPGRWAVGYPYLYVMYRVLNEFRPKRILEFGLGESTKMIAQYAATHLGVSSITVEQDPAWINYFSRDCILPEISKISLLPVVESSHLGDEQTLVYSGLGSLTDGMTFDFISIDGPAHSHSDKFRRIDVLELVPAKLDSDFVIMLDDYDVPECKAAWELLCDELTRSGTKYSQGLYRGQKDVAILCSSDWSFLCSI